MQLNQPRLVVGATAINCRSIAGQLHKRKTFAKQNEKSNAVTHTIYQHTNRTMQLNQPIAQCNSTKSGHRRNRNRLLKYRSTTTTGDSKKVKPIQANSSSVNRDSTVLFPPSYIHVQWIVG